MKQGISADALRRISELSPQQRARLEKRLIERVRKVPAPGIRPRKTQNFAPVSFAQQRLWFAHQLQPDSPFYNIRRAYRLEGHLRITALQKALEELVRRHEVLRTSFLIKEEQPVQVISESWSVPFDLIDFTSYPEEEKKRVVESTLNQEAGRPFDLAHSPVLRAVLLRIGPDEDILLLVIHHIATDGWAMSVFAGELSTLYNSFCNRQPSPLAERSLQYADFSVWQRESLHEGLLEDQLSYWKRCLGGATRLNMPTDRPRRSVPVRPAESVPLAIPESLTHRLRVLSKQEGATLFMALIAVFGILCRRYTGSDDIVIGTPIEGRNRRELEDLIGFFLNTLALRFRPRGELTFRQYLREVKKTALEAYSNQDLPFERLVQELRPGRSFGDSPLVPVMFTLQNAPEERLNLSGLSLTRLPVESHSTQFELTVLLNEGQGLSGKILYDSSLFNRETVARFSGHFSNLLEGVAKNPDCSLSRLPMLSDQEREQLLVSFNDTGSRSTPDKSIHQLFEARAEASPDSIAVSIGESRLSYGELNHRADRVACELQRLGCGLESAVGVCVEPSPETIVALLGILKAGGCYVPLDPGVPIKFLERVVSGSDIELLLTDGEKLERAKALGIPTFLISDLLADSGRAHPESNRVEVAPDNLAYVIYTSGSTGRPKGVAVPHRAVIRLVIDTNYIHLDETDRIAQASNLAFDAATFEIWGALLNGSQLLIVPRDQVLTPGGLAEEIKSQEISVLFLTTALFNQFARLSPGMFKSLKTLLFGGEMSDPPSVRRVVEQGMPRRLIHVYGPTEATTFSSWYPVESVPDSWTSVPIGRPISNTELHVLDVLDKALEPVPVGVTGELFIGGPGLARGYWNQPQLTSERFIPDPFSAQPEAQLYRTGDLVRRLEDGSIDFLGRADRQLKIRGFRVELSEIEHVVRSHPDVADAVVVSREDEVASLSAYVVPKSRSGFETINLRDFLRESLPKYMVPSSIVPIEKIPLNANRKVDRRALPHVQKAIPVGSVVQPSDPLESQLHSIWQDFLGTGRFGISDDFFDIGGHSLMAMQIVAEIEKRLGTSLPVSAMFRAPTVAALARLIRSRSSGGEFQSLVPVRPDGAEPPFFWIHGDASIHFLAAEITEERPLYLLDHLDPQVNRIPYSTVQEFSELYLKEIRSVRPDGPYYLGGFSFGGVVAFDIAQKLRQEGKRVPLLFLLDPSPLRAPSSEASGKAKILRNPPKRSAGLKVLASYLYGGIRWRVLAPWQKARLRLRLAYGRFRLTCGLPVSTEEQRFYTLQKYIRAVRSYLASPYPGRSVFYHSKDDDVAGRWLQILNNAEVHQISCPKHEDLIRMPYALSWLEQLKQKLGKQG